MLPLGKEKIVLRATIISAIMNLGLNFIFIFVLQERGAAITTLIAEFFVVLIEMPFVKKYIKVNIKTVIKSFLGCAYLILFCIF